MKLWQQYLIEKGFADLPKKIHPKVESFTPRVAGAILSPFSNLSKNY